MERELVDAAIATMLAGGIAIRLAFGRVARSAYLVIANLVLALLFYDLGYPLTAALFGLSAPVSAYVAARMGG